MGGVARRAHCIRAPARTCRRSCPGESGGSLGYERRDALAEVTRARERVLDLRFQVELSVHIGVEHPVERLFRARVRACGPVCELLNEYVRLGLKALVGIDEVHETPLER